MKKKLLLLGISLLLLLFTAVPSFATNLFYSRDAALKSSASGATLGAGTALVTGRCFGKTLIATSDTASAYLLIYDATSATGTPIDVPLGSANTTTVVDLKDLEFGTGVFAKAVDTGNATNVTLTYSQ